MQSPQHAETQEERKLAKGVPWGPSLQRDGDGPASVLLSVRQSHGGGHHVRPGEEEVQRFVGRSPRNTPHDFLALTRI